MKEYLRETFANGGHLSRCLSSYSPRQSQIDYAMAVDAALAGQRHIVLDGPTGTGKSIGYGVPIAFHVSQTKERAAIVTSNIALQEQLVTKDLPLLSEALPFKFTYGLLKGRNNYVCSRKLDEYETKPRLFEEKDDKEMAKAIITWATMTELGDVSELPFEPSNKVWREFSVTSEDCLGSSCPFKNDCFGNAARLEAETCSIVVTNYHLLFAHFKNLAEKSRGILPSFRYLVMDEAHRAADIARSFFGFRFGPPFVRRAGRFLDTKTKDNLDMASEVFFDALKRHHRSPDYDTRLREENPVHWIDLYNRLDESADSLASAAAAQKDDPVRRHDLAASGRRLKEASMWLQSAMTLQRQSDVAYYIDKPYVSGDVALCGKPADISGWLNEHVFKTIPSVVMTSATMATNGSFDFAVTSLGVVDADELIVPSPFNWKKQALLVLPDMPDPRSNGFSGTVARKVAAAVRYCEGRTLALFTSYRVLEEAYDFLINAGLPYKILKQGTAPRSMLVDQFKEDESSVLLGTESFWSGVDVPGEALTCLVVDKLPFPRPDDPVLSLICDQDERWFMNQSVPRAVVTLRQGVGRLIRSVSDVGVVVLLDSRVTTKSYGSVFLNSLPRMRTTSTMKDIQPFLQAASQRGAA